MKISLFKIHRTQSERGHFVDAEPASVDHLQDRAVAKTPGFTEIGELEDMMNLLFGERLLGRSFLERTDNPGIGEGVLENEALLVKMLGPQLGRIQITADRGQFVTVDLDAKGARLEGLGVNFEMRRLKGLRQDLSAPKESPELLHLGHDFLRLGRLVTVP